MAKMLLKKTGGGRETRVNKGFPGLRLCMRAATALLTAALFFVCVMVSPVAVMTVRADDNTNPLDENPLGTTIDTNYSEITRNNGNVTVNNGTVVANWHFIDTNSSSGVVRTNHRTIDRNEGNVVNNVGYAEIFYNSGNVTTNEGIIVGNQGTIFNNEGSVETNNGRIYNNSGSIVENNGEVDRNLSGGTVYNYSGGRIIENNGTVHNYGGTVGAGSGTNILYYSVEIDDATANTAAAYSNGFDQNQNKNWLQEGATGTITITPASGYQIDGINVGQTGATAVKNADGSWTITVSNIQKNIAANEWGILSGKIVIAPVNPSVPQGQNQLHIPLGIYMTGNGSGSMNPANGKSAPVEEISENFDSVYYADNNPDLYDAYGYNHDLLWNHYVLFGKQEGRKARFIDGIHRNAEELPAKEDFDAKAYADYYEDLFAAYGYDEDALWNHYLLFGRTEGRMVFLLTA